jgi:hypothetical protein
MSRSGQSTKIKAIKWRAEKRNNGEQTLKDLHQLAESYAGQE